MPECLYKRDGTCCRGKITHTRYGVLCDEHLWHRIRCDKKHDVNDDDYNTDNETIGTIDMFGRDEDNER